ncbi:MAG: hypothetical protein LBH70_09285 [Spirochaetaceae bacterium]|jgi:hypothetical protein|nr:hypothetical protein [Spirochaetaceae bacterium]
MERIITIEVEGPAGRQAKLGFDTGLSAHAFAQAKLALSIARCGILVYPDGKTSVWRPEGAVEQKTMVIYGPAFPGERLDRLLEGPGERALDALRRWIPARAVLARLARSGPAPEGWELPAPWPAAALLSDGSPDAGSVRGESRQAFPPGVIFFPPDNLARRAVEAEGDGAWLNGAGRWTHPDHTGEDAAVFTAAAMLYQIVCGAPPYSAGDPERLYSDIREGVYTPPSLMAPGLDPGIAALISSALAPASATAKRPSLEDFRQKTGPLFSGGPERFFRRLREEERAKILAERKQFDRKKAAGVKTRRFIRRNTAVIGGAAIALLILALAAGSIVKGRRDLPTTRGMSPREVIAAYYGSFETLDHTLMEACVVGKAGKGDINLVTNIFVISRVREAYEMKRPVVAAREWLDAGAAPTDLAVTGVTDLRLSGEDEDESDGEVRYRVDYTLWLPAGYMETGGAGDGQETPPETLPALPAKTGLTDDVRLILQKGAWRISEIERTLQEE